MVVTREQQKNSRILMGMAAPSVDEINEGNLREQTFSFVYIQDEQDILTNAVWVQGRVWEV